MADVTDVLGIPFPEGGDTFAAADIQDLAERVDEAPGIESLTSAEIAALTSAEKADGRVVYNSTTSKLQVSNGTTFADVDAAALASAALKLPLAGGTMSGAIAMGGSKVTGLAAASSNGDAVRYEQMPQVRSGVTSALAASGTATLTFSPAFTTTPNVVATPTTTVGPTGRWAISSISTTQATLTHLNDDSLNVAFQWIAVGT